MKPAAWRCGLLLRKEPSTGTCSSGRPRVTRGATVSRSRQLRVGHLPLATTAYKADTQGVLRPVLPSRCVFAARAETCSIFVDHYRSRKTGPRFPLAVVGCSKHPHGRYTLYPPGHYPYGYEQLAPYSPSGQLLVDATTGQPPWETTIFAAAVDAARGERWPSESPWFKPHDPRRRRTQDRRLELAGRLMGVHPAFDNGMRERIATRLGVATMRLLSGAESWRRDRKTRGTAIMAVLLALALRASLLDRIPAAGAESGLWAQHWRWDAARAIWIIPASSDSRESEHRRATTAGARSPPPTNLTALLQG